MIPHVTVPAVFWLQRQARPPFLEVQSHEILRICVRKDTGRRTRGGGGVPIRQTVGDN
jgi:hypothetical protein